MLAEKDEEWNVSGQLDEELGGNLEWETKKGGLLSEVMSEMSDW